MGFTQPMLYSMPSAQTAELTEKGVKEAQHCFMKWDEREAVLLRTIREFEEEGERPRFENLVDSTDLPASQVEFGLKSLLDEGCIDGIDASSMDGFDLLAIELRPRGRRAVGQWPTEIDATGTEKAEGELEVFISHSSTDREVARLLVELLRSALRLESHEIRCTSVDGYRLPAGADTKEQLRQEIHDSRSFVGLLSPESLESTFVMFELGARWGTRKLLAPLLIRDVSPDDLDEPLRSLNSLDATNSAQVHQLVGDISSVLGISPEPTDSYQHKVEKLCQAASKPV